MRVLLVLLLAVGLAPGAAAGQVAFTAEAASDAPGIYATGVGEMPVSPTRAVVFFTVETGAASGVLAASENAVRRKRLLDTLTAMGYRAADIPTYAYAVGPTADAPMRPPGPAAERFTGRVGLQVVVSPVSRLEDVIHAILWVNDTQIQMVSFEADDPDARNRAIEAAVAQAQRDAEAMAHAAGGRLGPLLQLSTFPDFTGWASSRAIALERAVSMRGPTLVPSDVAVRVTVHGRWEFRPR